MVREVIIFHMISTGFPSFRVVWFPQSVRNTLGLFRYNGPVPFPYSNGHY